MELSEQPPMGSSDAHGMQDDAAYGAATEAVSPRPALPMLDDATRSPDPSVCPFFRREAEGRLFVPLGSPDEENVCAAIGVPKPQSARQQELVCLKASHAECPRYLRGALAFPEPPRARRQSTLPRATLAALLILVLSAGISFGFVVQRGGIDMPVVGSPGPGSSAVAVVVSASPATAESAAPSVEAPASVPAASPSATATPSPSPSPSPSPTPAPTPSPSPSPSPEPTQGPTPKPTKTPTSDRYKLLDPCPDRDGCWIYTVRAGDNLFSIAKYFGHSLNTIYEWNPQYPETALKKGAEIRMPPPTR